MVRQSWRVTREESVRFLQATRFLWRLQDPVKSTHFREAYFFAILLRWSLRLVFKLKVERVEETVTTIEDFRVSIQGNQLEIWQITRGYQLLRRQRMHPLSKQDTQHRLIILLNRPLILPNKAIPSPVIRLSLELTLSFSSPAPVTLSSQATSNTANNLSRLPSTLWTITAAAKRNAQEPRKQQRGTAVQ